MAHFTDEDPHLPCSKALPRQAYSIPGPGPNSFQKQENPHFTYCVLFVYQSAKADVVGGEATPD